MEWSSSDEDDEGMELMLGAAAAVATTTTLMAAAAGAVANLSSDEEEDPYSHLRNPRAPKKTYDWERAYSCIQADYLGPQPLFDDRQFEIYFRVSRSRFQRIMEDVAAAPADISHFWTTKERLSRGTTIEAKLMLSLKTLAYGVPSHTFCDYFQMSWPLARECCYQFDKAINSIYTAEYLRKPTAADIKGIVKLHRCVHKVDGMLGSIDCSHTNWKNCPVAWQGSYSGKEKKPTIVLEAICDYHLWFWHVSYGYAGTLNDLNILSLSPFLDAILDGSFASLEEEAKVVPYYVDGQLFRKLFVLVDGIYPLYSRFIRGIKEPLGKKEKRFTQWQEGARKDIERAFGVLQGKFQFIARPIHLHKVADISNRVGTCILLHNMCVSDRVMGDVRACYNPAHSMTNVGLEVEAPEDLPAVQQAAGDANAVNNIGVENAPEYVQQFVARLERFRDLEDKHEHARLMASIIRQISSKEAV